MSTSGAEPASELLPLAPGERGQALTAVDRTWLRLDEPENRMHVHGVMVLDGDISAEEVAGRIGERFAVIPRFHQRIATDGGRLVWADDADFDIRRHVVGEALPEPGDDAALAAAIERYLHRGFDRAHPLWEFRIFSGLAGGGTAVFGRIHHAIGDGVALMVVMLALTDLSPTGPPTVEAGGSLGQAALNPFLELLTTGGAPALAAARKAAEQVMPETMRLLQAPAEAFARLGALGRAAGSSAALARILGSRSEPATPFKGALGIEKRVAWTESIPLADVKRVSGALGGTINDVLNTAMAGGLRRYLARHGSLDESFGFRCVMPVNLRPLDELAALGNRFGLIFLRLPVGIVDPLRRLEETRRRSAALKRSAEPLLVHGLLDLAGRLPLAAQNLLVRVFGAKATAVFSNVPGPRETLWFAGRAIRDFFFWVPQAGRLGLGVSILSYAGAVRMGVGTDAGLVPDPERIVDGFRAEWDALLDAAAG